VILNEKPDYDGRQSKSTPRMSARQPSSRRQRSNAAARLRFKSGDLKALHLNRTKLDLSLVFHLSADKEEDVAASKEDSMEKHRKKNRKKHQHEKEYHNHGHHKRHHGQYAHRLSANGIVGPYPVKARPGSPSEGSGSELSCSPREVRDSIPTLRKAKNVSSCMKLSSHRH
jgi:hypothetical protein